MNQKYLMGCRLLILLPMLSQIALADPASKPLATQPAATSPAKLTVAILDFQANTPGSPELGQQIGETLLAALSGQPGYTLVDRSSLAQTLREHELTMSGLVTADQAAKIGKLVGAKILITGKVFPLDKQLFITAKLIGVETSLVDGIVIKGEKEAETGALVMQLSERLAKRIPEVGPRLIAADDVIFDPLPELKKKLAGRALPKVSVHISERHLPAGGGARADTAGDPAAENEVRRLLIECGFTIVDGDALDQSRAGVQIAITGESFSEFGARIGSLYSCTARSEIQAINLADKTVRLSDRDSSRAVDLSENLAAKTALQKSGHVLGVRLLEYFARALPGK